MHEIKIRDLYTGKPDAKDEINFEGLEEFIKTFVVADHFQLDSLLYGNNCFITGFKGTGKTALLFYLTANTQTSFAYDGIGRLRSIPGSRLPVYIETT